MIKRIIKSVYMWVRHPLIKLLNLGKKDLYVGKCPDIRCNKQIVLGDNVRIGDFVRINIFNKSSNLVIGNDVYMCNRNSFLVGGNITIGDHSLFASDILVCSENHSTNLSLGIPYKDQSLVCEPVDIGSNCWIGEKVIILPGVKIGDNCIIGGGSVVTKDIPCNSIAVGNPARVIKKYSKEYNEWKSI